MNLSEIIRRLRDITGGSTNCGWVCDEVAMFIHGIARLHKPDLVIQTGHLWGKSAAVVLDALDAPFPLDPQPQQADQRFAQFLKEHEPRRSHARLISIDPDPMGVPNWLAGVAFLKDSYGDRFEFVRTTSREFFETFATDAQNIMGIIDGDHTDAGCEADLQSLGALGAKVIVVDDISWLPSLAHVATRFAVRAGYGISLHRVYNGIAVLTRE